MNANLAENYPYLAAAAFGLMAAWLWARAAVAAWRAGLPAAAGIGCAVGAAAGVCGLALAVPAVWESWRAAALLGSALILGSTAGPALALWGLRDAWRTLEAPPADDRPAEPR